MHDNHLMDHRHGTRDFGFVGCGSVHLTGIAVAIQDFIKTPIMETTPAPAHSRIVISPHATMRVT